MYMQFGRFLKLVMAALLPLVTLGDEGGSLPAEYLRLEYIRNTSGQVIRTGIVPNGAVPVVEIKYGMDDLQDNSYVFGYWSDQQNAGTAIGWHNEQFWLRTWQTSGGGFGTWDYATHEVRLNTKEGTFVDGKIAHSTLADLPDNASGAAEYCLLGRTFVNSTGSAVLQPARCRLCYATILLNGELVRNYIPCLRMSDGEVGLYETVEGKFCTGEFAGKQLEAGPIERYYQISDIDGAKWMGENEGPHPEVRDVDGEVLTEGVDYTLQWKIYAKSKACIIVRGKGDYAGRNTAFYYEATFGKTDRWSFFRKCEYVESAGSGPYFKTGVVPNGRVPVVRLKYRMNELMEGVYALGYWNDAENAGTAIGWHNNQFWLRVWQTSGGGFGEADEEDHVVELNTPEGTKADGSVVHPELKSVRDDSQSEYYLMGRSMLVAGVITPEPCNCRIYETTIWMDGEKVREFVPAVTIDGQEFGLFDEVEGRFYRNAGTGTVVGEAMIPLEYVESTGSQLVAATTHPELERRTPTFELDFQLTAIPENSGWAFGYWDSALNCGTAFGVYTKDGKKLFRQRVGAVAEDLAQPVDLNRHRVVINAADGSKFDKKDVSGSLLRDVEEPGDESALKRHLYYLFGRWGSSDGSFSGRIYGFKVWLNGELAADYRPMMKVAGSEREIGLYDEVGEKFYPSTGDSLIAGPVLMENPKRGLMILFY